MNFPQASLMDCFDSDEEDINPWKYTEYQSARHAEARKRVSHLMETSDEIPIKKKSRSHSKKPRRPFLEYYDSDGELRKVQSEKSIWYLAYVKSPLLSAKFYKRFRRRFRLPYAQFLELVEDARAGNWFPRWMRSDAAGKSSSPLHLMILGALRYTGRGWTFDDVEEATGICQETHRQFYHEFITIGSTILFKKYVVEPATNEEANNVMHEMKQAGLNGAVGSTDATHVVIEKCSHRLANNHLGGKMKHTARTYNMTVNHRRRILSTTTGHPSRWNDKTLIRFDKFVTGMKEGTKLEDVEFDLFEEKDSKIVKIKYKGVWVIVDNGYLKWSVTIPPFKKTSDQREIRWSHWMESIRKDVECAFGIMKGRWRILKSGIRLHGVEAADKIWMTCCALHNWLLEVDGLDDKWENGVPSDWEGELGLFSKEDTIRHIEPFAIQRLNLNAYDTSAMGKGNDMNIRNEYDDDSNDDESINIEEERADNIDEQKVRHVRKLSLDFFRGRLVEHFHILWSENKLIWPKRNEEKLI
jgi:hypothetical protein